MNYHCEFIQHSAQPVLSIRTRSSVNDLPRVCGESYQAIMQYLSQIGHHPSNAPFVAYYNMDMQDLDIEIGFPVAASLLGRDSINASEIPEGKYASCLYVGPYSQVEPAYNALMHWMEQNGYQYAGVGYEFYLNDITTVPESELQTKIMLKIV